MLLRVVTDVTENTLLSVTSDVACNVANRVDKRWNRCRNMWFWPRMASAGRGTNCNSLFLFLFIFYFFFLSGNRNVCRLLFLFLSLFSFLGLDSFSFYIFDQFLCWLKKCEFLKKDSISWSYSFNYSQATSNITRASVTFTPFSTDYFIGHSLFFHYLLEYCHLVVLCCITKSVLNNFFGRSSYLPINSACLNCKKHFPRRQPTPPRELTAR